MDYTNKRYLIIPTDITSSINFNEVMETSVNTLRISSDGKQTFVKYYVTIVDEDKTETHIDVETGEEILTEIKAGVYGRPSIYSEEYPEYTHNQIFEVLQGSEWNSQLEN